MAIRKIYINPGDVLHIHLIGDPELPRTNKEWRYQVRPWSGMVTVKGPAHYTFMKPVPTLEIADIEGNTIGYL